jgi:hypothetical protein
MVEKRGFMGYGFTVISGFLKEDELRRKRNGFDSCGSEGIGLQEES